VCVCGGHISASRVECALAFTAVPGYHENTSVSVAQAVQPVTFDYTYPPLRRAQEAGEGETRGWGRGSGREQNVGGEGEGDDVCVCVLKRVVKCYS